MHTQNERHLAAKAPATEDTYDMRATRALGSFRMRDASGMVYVVDDDEAVRDSLRLLLKSSGLVVTTMASAQEFLDNHDVAQAGCLVLDVRMPGFSGLDLQHELNRRGAIIPVIFMSGHGDVPMAVEAMQHGAFDFLQKPFRDQDLLDRIQTALRKDCDNREQLLNSPLIRERFESLTPRESEVLVLMAEGRPNKIIAAALGISQRTVEIHRARVMEKMQASSLAQLVRMTFQLALPPAKPAPAAPAPSRTTSKL
jgi:two-component system, LuxR family, response regulator FixJ